MKYFKVLTCFMFIVILSGCTTNQLMDLSGFIYEYNKIAEDTIDFSDFSFEKDENREFKLIKGNIFLTLKEGEKGKICQCSLGIVKLNQKGEKSQSLTSDTEKFLVMLKNTLQAFCGYDINTSEKLIDEFMLGNETTYSNLGELTKTMDNFYFVYYSTELTSSMTIYNKYLCEIEPTEKPLSKPAYGEYIGADN